MGGGGWRSRQIAAHVAGVHYANVRCSREAGWGVGGGLSSPSIMEEASPNCSQFLNIKRK